MNKKTKKNSTLLKIFNDPSRSRVLWHDTKIFPSAVMIYLENMFSGVYGPISRSLNEPLGQLQEAALFHLILLENNSILNKIQLKSIRLKPQNLLLSSVWGKIEHFLKPFFKRNKIKFKLNIDKHATVQLDERYASTLLQNMILLAFKLGKTELKEISMTIHSHLIQLEVLTDFDQKSIKKRINIKEIYAEKSQGFSFTALIFFVNQQLAALMKKKFNLLIENKKLIFQL